MYNNCTASTDRLLTSRRHLAFTEKHRKREWTFSLIVITTPATNGQSSKHSELQTEIDITHMMNSNIKSCYVNLGGCLSWGKRVNDDFIQSDDHHLAESVHHGQPHNQTNAGVSTIKIPVQSSLKYKLPVHHTV